MKILSVPLVPLLFATVLGAACTPAEEPVAERATVNAEHSSLRSKDSPTSRTLKVLEPGTHVDILERQGRWYRVRLDQMEGWMEVSTLLTDSMRNKIQENINSAVNQAPQNTGTLGQDANLRVDPGRDTSILRRVSRNTAVEVLERRTIPRSDAPDRPDAWLKVRTSPTEVGWVLSSFVDFDVPEGIAQYTEDYAYPAVKTLQEIDDPVSGLVRWYVVAERRPGIDPNLDYTGIRVFTWNNRLQRYETALRLSNLRGVYPLEVSRDEMNRPVFRFHELNGDGTAKNARTFVMNGVVAREAKAAAK